MQNTGYWGAASGYLKPQQNLILIWIIDTELRCPHYEYIDSPSFATNPLILQTIASKLMLASTERNLQWTGLETISDSYNL